MRCLILLKGNDDVTEIERDISLDEMKFLAELSAASYSFSDSACCPKLIVEITDPLEKARAGREIDVLDRDI